jgi:anti-sigma B factor antagonist
MINMAEPQSHFSVSKADGVTVVEFADRKILDELAISEIQEELSRLVAEMGDVKLLLNFKNVEHLSSAALGTLITLNKQVGERRGEMKLSDIAPPIYEVFKITRLNKLFSIHPTKQDALGSFR